MTTTPADLERKVRQMDNDVQAIYTLLGDLQSTTSRIAGVQARHANRLDELAAHLEAHDKRFDAVDKRFDAVDKRFDGVDQRLGGIDQRLEGLDSKMDEVLTILRER